MSVPARCCTAPFSPHGHFNQVPLADVQRAFRRGFQRWGLPGQLRVDNGSPWGSWSDLPPPLALWLIGLGIDLHWNPPRCPQDNGVVERSQGLAQAWAEPGQCRSVAELQQRLDAEDRLQREVYPYQGDRSRGEVFAALRHSGRPYRAAGEVTQWDWQRVCAHVAGYAVPRRVDGCGKIGLYARKVYVGLVNKRREVVVQLDADSLEWVITDPAGRELCRRPLEEFTAEQLRRL
jgi:transposase InsO family protein